MKHRFEHADREDCRYATFLELADGGLPPAWVYCHWCCRIALRVPPDTKTASDVNVGRKFKPEFSPAFNCEVRSRTHLRELQKRHGTQDYDHSSRAIRPKLHEIEPPDRGTYEVQGS